MKRQSNLRAGFTLVELLMVMVVLGVLAAIVIPKFADRNKQAKESSLKSDLHIVRSAIANFQADTGLLPVYLADLTASSTANFTNPGNAGDPFTGTWAAVQAGTFHGPYLSAIPTDPVSGSAFNYTWNPTSPANAVTSSATGNALDGTAYSTW